MLMKGESLLKNMPAKERCRLMWLRRHRPLVSGVFPAPTDLPSATQQARPRPRERFVPILFCDVLQESPKSSSSAIHSLLLQ